jgi:hypothetical protein
MSLGSEMIDLIRFDIVDDVVDLAGVSQEVLKVLALRMIPCTS